MRGAKRALTDETLRAAHRQHATGINLKCLGRHYGVTAATLSANFKRLGLPVYNFTWGRVRTAVLAGKER